MRASTLAAADDPVPADGDAVGESDRAGDGLPVGETDPAAGDGDGARDRGRGAGDREGGRVLRPAEGCGVGHAAGRHEGRAGVPAAASVLIDPGPLPPSSDRPATTSARTTRHAAAVGKTRRRTIRRGRALWLGTRITVARQCRAWGQTSHPARHAGLGGAPDQAARCGSLAAVVANPWIIRPAAAEDADFLGDMLTEAANWSPEWRRRSRQRVLSAPQTAHYVAGWPRDTDLGVIAETGAGRIGAAWPRFFSASDAGYGFVSADVPELTIGVVAAWRGRGVGRALLRAAAGQAREAGIGRISLSVERKNFARSLYLSEGYQVVDASDPGSDTMMKEIAG
jgi:GNAT superfamily N-acetyltransferase